MSVLDLKDVNVVDLPPIEIPVQWEQPVAASTVAPGDRLPIVTFVSPYAPPLGAQLVKWLEDNLVIRNNLALDRLEIYANTLGDVEVTVFSKITPREGETDVTRPHMKDGKIELKTSCRIFASLAEGKHDLVQSAIRDTVRQHLMHEIDECLVFGGVLPFDPHR